MAVSLNSAGTVAVSQGFNTQATVTCDSGGSNRVALLLLQLHPHQAAPTSIGATFDFGGANQAMTLIETWVSGGFTHCMFGLIAPTAAAARSCRAVWTNDCAYCAEVSVWAGANQDSVAAAFANPGHANGTSSVAQINITSAANGVVAGHYNAAASRTGGGETALFAPSLWGLSGENGWGGYNLSNPSSTSLQSTLDASVPFRVQGVYIPEFTTPVGHPSRKRMGGVTHAPTVKGKNTRIW